MRVNYVGSAKDATLTPFDRMIERKRKRQAQTARSREARMRLVPPSARASRPRANEGRGARRRQLAAQAKEARRAQEAQLRAQVVLDETEGYR